LSCKHRFGGTFLAIGLGSGLRPGLQDWANWEWELPSLGQGLINSQAASAARLSDIIDAIVGMSIQPRADDPTQNLERRVDQAVDHLVADAPAITILQDPSTVRPRHSIEVPLAGDTVT